MGLAMISISCQNQLNTPITPASPTSQVTTETSISTTSTVTLPAVAPGWRRFQFTGVTIDLPPAYLVSSDEAKNRWADLTALGLEEESIAALLEKFITPAKIFAVDKTTMNQKFVTNMMISIDSGSKAKSLDDYRATVVKELTTEWQIQKQDKVADRLRISAISKDATKPVNLIVYLANSKNQYWLTVFTTATDRLDKQLPEFDSIIKSMHINF